MKPMMRLTTLFNHFFFLTFFIASCSFGQEYFSFFSWTNGSISASNWRSDPNPVQFNPYTGCLYADISVTNTAASWQANNPRYHYSANGMPASAGYGMRLGVDWGNGSQTVTYTITFKNASGGSVTEYPVEFSIYDINAHACASTSINRFIDVVSVVGYRQNLSTTVNPTYANAANSGGITCTSNTVSGNQIKGSGNCGSNRTNVTFPENVARIVITYTAGTGHPASLDCGTAPAALVVGDNPRPQEIYFSPFKINTAVAPTAITGTTNICSGTTTTLTAVGGNASSRWYTGSCGGTLIGTGASITVAPTANTTYYVANPSACGITSCATNTVTVYGSTPSATGLIATDYLWTGAQSTTYETAGNWLSWNGSSFAIPPATPSSSNNVRIKPVSGCIVNSPIITTSGANCNGITIESSAQITSNNSTNLTVAGNWSNSGTYIENQGKITFTGSGKTLTCSGGETFYDLSSASTSILTLNNDATVSNGLWINGIISTGSNRVNLNTSAIDGVSTGVIDGNYSGHVYGNFRRAIQSNTATYRFPMGVGTTLTTNRRLMEWVNNNLTGVSYLDCSVSNSFKGSGQNTDANISSSLAVQNGKVVYLIHPEAQWRLGPNTNPTGGSYGMRLYVQNFSTLSASSDNKFIVLKRPDNSTTFADYNTFESTTTIPAQNLAGRVFNSGNGYAQRLGFTSFSEFVIGSVPTPLGVELGTFDLKCDRDGYMLNYSTVSEINSSHFQISTSNNGYDYTVNSEVDAQGYSSSLIEYQIFIAKGSYNYVQLKQFDFDGQSEELFTLHVPSCDEGPKPFIRQDLNEDVLVILPYNAPSEIFLYSTDGKLLFEGNSVGVENEVFELPRELFTVGTYFLRVDNKMVDSEVFKFIKF